MALLSGRGKLRMKTAQPGQLSREDYGNLRARSLERGHGQLVNPRTTARAEQ